MKLLGVLILALALSGGFGGFTVSAQTAPRVVNINTATKAQLEAFPCGSRCCGAV